MQWGSGNIFLQTGMEAGTERIVARSMQQAGITLIRGGPLLIPDHPDESQQRTWDRIQIFKQHHIHTLAVTSPWKTALHQQENPILELYQQALKYAQANRATVACWELFNEPDMAFSPRMPDLDVAMMKAVYLGLKAGYSLAEDRSQEWADTHKSSNGLHIADSATKLESQRGCAFKNEFLARGPIVIGPSLALPEGPWARRAARNGLWHYADGFNFHFYGLLDALPTVMDNYTSFVADLHHQKLCHAPTLPMWLTEINRAFTTPDDLTADTQRRQGDFLTQAATLAIEKGIVAFIPFTAYWKKEPTFNFFAADGRPNASWQAYANFITSTPNHLKTTPMRSAERRRDSSENRAPSPTTSFYSTPHHSNIALPPTDVPEVILNWQPDNETTIPHKMSGCYWPKAKNEPIAGEIVITNLGQHAVTGWLEVKTAALHSNLTLTFDSVHVHRTPSVQQIPIQLEPYTWIAIPMTVHPKDDRYFREWLSFECEYVRDHQPNAGLQRLTPRSSAKPVAARRSDANHKTNSPKSTSTQDMLNAQPLHQKKRAFYFAQNKRRMPVTASALKENTDAAQRAANTTPGRAGTLRSTLFFGVEANPYAQARGTRSKEPGDSSQDEGFSPAIPASAAKILHPRPLALNVPKHQEHNANHPVNRLTHQPLFFSDDTFTTHFVNGARPATWTATATPWIGLNGLHLRPTQASAFPWMAFTDAPNNDVRNYPCAIARVEGLPDAGFVVLKTNRRLGRDTWIWVYLVDTAGQQYCIWDNQGRNRHIQDNRVFLNLEDFQILFHGRVTDQPQLVPANICEIHVRFGFSRPHHPILFNLAFAQVPSPNISSESKQN